MTSEERTRELLLLARDAATAIAAFVARPGADAIVASSPGDTTPAEDEEIVRLATAALAHEAGGEGRYRVELAGGEGERLGCVAVPVRRGGERLAVLGVVDYLLLESNGDLEGMLVQVAVALAEALAGIPGAVGGPDQPDEAAAAAAAAEASGAGAGEGEAAAQPAAAEPDRGAWTLLGAMIEQLPEGILVARADGMILYANQTLATLAHRRPQELTSSDVWSVLRDEPGGGKEGPDGDGETVRPAPGVAGLLGATSLGRRLALQLPGGRSIPVDVRGRRIEAGIVGEVYAALVRDARQPLLGPVEVAGAALLEEILDSIDDAIVVCDADDRVVLANRAASRLLLAEGGELAGRPFPFGTELHTPEGAPVRFEMHPVVRALHGTTVVAEHVVLEPTAEHRRHLLLSARPFGVAGSPGALVIAREITAQLDQEARLMQLALHDPLTGLANRYLLLDYLQRTFRQVRSRGGAMALLYLDLDDFKSINDTRGHDVGDEVLVAVAGRLQGATRGSDLVARLSGDEFVIVATAAHLEQESIEMLMGRLRQVLSAPYHIRDDLLSVGASIGWVIADPQLEDPMALLVRADEAMYRQKQARGARRGGGMGW